MTIKQVIAHFCNRLDNAITLKEINDVRAEVLALHYRESFDEEDYRMVIEQSVSAWDRVNEMDDLVHEVRKHIHVLNQKERIPTGDDQDNEDPCDLGASFKTSSP